MESSNQADLHMIAQMGIYPERTIRETRPKLRSVVFMVMAGLRMRRRQQEWAKNQTFKESIIRTLEHTRRKARKSVVV